MVEIRPPYQPEDRDTNMPMTDTACRNAKPAEKPRKLSDGGGLFLHVSVSGGKSWRVAYRYDGKQKLLTIGPYPAFSLADARRGRDEAKAHLARGVDPSELKKSEKRSAKLKATDTFEATAREWHEKQRARWTESTAQYTLARLEADIFPAIGSRPIAHIEPPELLATVRVIEARGSNEIARRTLATCSQVFRYAIASGRAQRDPSQDLKGALAARPRQQHHRMMPRDELPVFLARLSTYEGERRTALALRLALLTFVRTTELRAAVWAEFEGLDDDDPRAPLWRIPDTRMKAGRPHLVPLAPQSVSILRELKDLSSASDWVFPAKGRERHMSNNTMLFALYRMGYHGRATVHGFRSLASTILNEAGFNSDWIERQLAHDERNSVRGAYNAAQYLEGRRRMMIAWAEFLDKVERTRRLDYSDLARVI